MWTLNVIARDKGLQNAKQPEGFGYPRVAVQGLVPRLAVQCHVPRVVSRGLGNLTLVRMFAAKGVPKKAKGVPLKDKFVLKDKGVPKKDKGVQNAKQPKAKEEPPKLFYLCNFPDCTFKSTDSSVVSSHFRHVHGKNETECWECGNGVDDHHPCRTFLCSCPMKKNITNYRELNRLRVRTAKDQQKMFAEEDQQKMFAEEQQQKKSAKK